MACQIPKPLPSRGMSGRSRNQAIAKTASFQQVKARPRRGADLAAMLGQQARHEHRQLEWDVKGDATRQHAEPPGRYGTLARPLVPGAPRPPGDLRLCPRVCPADRYATNAPLTVAEITSLITAALSGVVYDGVFTPSHVHFPVP